MKSGVWVWRLGVAGLVADVAVERLSERIKGWPGVLDAEFDFDEHGRFLRTNEKKAATLGSPFGEQSAAAWRTPIGDSGCMKDC